MKYRFDLIFLNVSSHSTWLSLSDTNPFFVDALVLMTAERREPKFDALIGPNLFYSDRTNSRDGEFTFEKELSSSSSYFQMRNLGT